ncbi:hypothetical protein [Lewinella sp. JB7]|uniref:hypothetical protein n=1 Tax=Lewinella sp. JB7 TaxID=2962887 RepID=UPI0020C9DAD9|nr:hypothetical protein [Lewinella sp. JB7]MCP9235515.1 hypothetical protein [Lewinella sp. JB7]
MKIVFHLLLVLLHCSLFGQSTAVPTDIIHLRKGKSVRGTVIDYDFGERITVLTPAGDSTDVLWQDVKRVHFGFRESTYKHQVTTSVGFARADPAVNFGWGTIETPPELALGLDYHLTRSRNALTVGVGPGVALLPVGWRREKVVQLTGLVEYGLGKARFRPVATLVAGANLPIGSESLRLTGRSVGMVVHPSLGLRLHPRAGGWGTVLVDLGYRFTDLTYRTASFDGFNTTQRNITYRRLTVTTGIRF